MGGHGHNRMRQKQLYTQKKVTMFAYTTEFLTGSYSRAFASLSSFNFGFHKILTTITELISSARRLASSSMSLPSFFPPHHLLLSYPFFFCPPLRLPSQVGILSILPSSQSSPSSSSLTWLLSRPATQLTFGTFLYYYTRLALLLPGSHLFFVSI